MSSPPTVEDFAQLSSEVKGQPEELPSGQVDRWSEAPVSAVVEELPDEVGDIRSS